MQEEFLHGEGYTQVSMYLSMQLYLGMSLLHLHFMWGEQGTGFDAVFPLCS